MKRVISASRRTELVGHYPDHLAERLSGLAPEAIHTIVLWTKDPSNVLHHVELRKALARADQVFMHWTVTGLGGTVLEPNVPPAEVQLKLIDGIISYLGDPRRLHWRYDPLVTARCRGRDVSNVELGRFRELVAEFARGGVTTVHTSFVTMYRKVQKRLAGRGIEFQELDEEARRRFLADLQATAEEFGMKMRTCCEPGFEVQRCIDGDLLSGLHPSHQPCRSDRARGQRELCGCTVSLDVGRYLPCPNGCIYCYAHPAGKSKRSE